MNCQECNNEFTPINNRGAEQKYCSTKCRSKAGTKRREARLINQNINNEKQSNRIRGYSEQAREIDSKQEFQEFDNRRNGLLSSRIHTDYNIIDSLKECYEARNETIFYKLKCESLEKEVSELKIEVSQLEMELDDIGTNTPGGEYSGVLGGVMEQFKTDPVNTINFATDLIQTLFKPKP
ncbi:MAG: hypothetical protein WCH52_11415 [Bacteroidota bacterium]